MTGKNVSVVIPVLRQEKAKRCIEAVLKDAPETEIISEVDHDRIGCPKMFKRLAEKSTRDMVLYLGDDTIPEPGFMDAALKAMESLPDGWGVVGLNTEPGNDHAHWLAHKKMLPLLDGEFFHTGYLHCWCDDELKDRAEEVGRWAFARDSRIKHDHPINNGVSDEFYEDVYGSQQKNDYDRNLYVKRKRERMGQFIGIGFPLKDTMLPVQFFYSFACMNKPAQYMVISPKYPHGGWSGSIADARNSLVYQAQEAGCSYLLMMDTDQTYPSDTLDKLMSHDVDVCGVRVHRRWPPFDPLLMRGELGKYVRVGDEETFSGDLVQVDATGTGCLLFKMEVFDHVPRPWFKLSEHDGKPVGEDIYFCAQARKAGINIYVDTSVEVGHMTLTEINRAFYMLYKKVNNGG